MVVERGGSPRGPGGVRLLRSRLNGIFDKSPAATRLVQTLHLEPIDLSQYTQMAPDGFHDVAMPGTPG